MVTKAVPVLTGINQPLGTINSRISFNVTPASQDINPSEEDVIEGEYRRDDELLK